MRITDSPELSKCIKDDDVERIPYIDNGEFGKIIKIGFHLILQDNKRIFVKPKIVTIYCSYLSTKMSSAISKIFYEYMDTKRAKLVSYASDFIRNRLMKEQKIYDDKYDLLGIMVNSVIIDDDSKGFFFIF